MSCQSCGSLDLKSVLDLGSQPICNKFSSSPDAPEKRYPLRLVRCEHCGLIQLSDVPPGSEVFDSNFNYLSSSSKGVVTHYTNVSESLVRRYKLGASDLVLDIASNDGVLLRPFKEQGIKVLGIEPVERIAAVATASGVVTIAARFEDTALEANPTLITAMDVLAHTDTVHPFLDNLCRLMTKTGAPFVCQSQYFPASMARTEYDTIYHEHARYFSVRSFQNLLVRHGIQVDDVEFNDFYGGSFIAHCSRGTKVKRFSETHSFDDVACKDFAKKARRSMEELVKLLASFKAEGKGIAGIGAPMKSSTLLNSSGIGPDLVDYLAEVNPLKIGTWSPGVHIPVVAEEHFFSNPPDVALVLSWNFAEQIIDAYHNRGFEGKFVVPIPEPRVV